jgi:hypothetical protein
MVIKSISHIYAELLSNSQSLRSPALLALDIESLIADYVSAMGTRTLGIKYGISRPTVRLRLKNAGVEMREGGIQRRRLEAR